MSKPERKIADLIKSEGIDFGLSARRETAKRLLPELEKQRRQIMEDIKPQLRERLLAQGVPEGEVDAKVEECLANDPMLKEIEEAKKKYGL